MKAVVYRGKEQIAVDERPVPVPGEGEVVIRVYDAHDFERAIALASTCRTT
jgi:NADPH:quinone reductase-like Zn-dependent oxidoreductase